MATKALTDALSRLLEHYVSLINSGDVGNWDPEKEDEVIAARAALNAASGAEPAVEAAKLTDADIDRLLSGTDLFGLSAMQQRSVVARAIEREVIARAELAFAGVRFRVPRAASSPQAEPVSSASAELGAQGLAKEAIDALVPWGNVREGFYNCAGYTRADLHRAIRTVVAALNAAPPTQPAQVAASSAAPLATDAGVAWIDSAMISVAEAMQAAREGRIAECAMHAREVRSVLEQHEALDCCRLQPR